MKGQTTAFGDVPAVRDLATRWTCTKCGNADQRTVRADLSRPSLDPKYAIGWCSCTPARKGVKGLTREAVALIESSHFDRAAFTAAEQLKADQKLLKRYRLGHALTKPEIAQVKALMDRLDR